MNAIDERRRLAREAIQAVAALGELAPVTIAARDAYMAAPLVGESVLTMPVTLANGRVIATDPAAVDEVQRLWKALSASLHEPKESHE
jgi:hypothetical protein